MDLHKDRSASTEGSALLERDERDGLRFTARAPLRAPRKRSFGGRKERRRVHPLVLLRVFDPVDQDYQIFGSEAVYHAWLIRRFDPDIKDLVVRPKPVAYLRLGQRFSAQPDLGFQREKETKPTLEFVSPVWEAERRHRYQHFAVTHHVHVRLTASDEAAEMRQTYIANLEQARQLMTLVKDEDLNAITEAICEYFLRRRTTTRGELGASLTCERALTCADCFDAALFHLHCRGAIQIHWSLNQYDDDTTISCL